mgnify:CR=1 FL=1
MKLYEFERAPNPRRVRFFIAEKGIDLASSEYFLARSWIEGVWTLGSHHVHPPAVVGRVHVAEVKSPGPSEVFRMLDFSTDGESKSSRVASKIVLKLTPSSLSAM